VKDDAGKSSDFSDAISSNPDIMNCTWSLDGNSNFVYSHDSIGSYNICFVTGKNKVYIQLKSPKSNTNICLFPTTSYDTGGSTYVGDAACIMPTSSTTIYPLQFTKNRPGYESSTISGAMIMYDSLHYFDYPYYGHYYIPNAYLICMQALYTSLLYSTNADTTWCDTFSAESKYVFHPF
jgi:hypothetical protein